MKIQYKNDDSIPPFEIISTEDREIIERFIDKETHYLVVCEINIADPSDRQIYYTLINPQTGDVISTQRRREEIEASGPEQIIEDAQHGLRLHILHTVDPHTGNEQLQQTLTDVTTGRVVARRQSSALRGLSQETLLTSYLAEQGTKQDQNAFWMQEYSQWSFERRATYWLDAFLKQMRFQSEAGFDKYAYYTLENYVEWKEHEPDIDRILEFIIDHFPDDSEEFRTEVYHRLGKN